MTADPQNADGPDTREDLAWEIRHCADRLDQLGERLWEIRPGSFITRSAIRSLRAAAREARIGAASIDGGSS